LYRILKHLGLRLFMNSARETRVSLATVSHVNGEGIYRH